MSEIAGVAGLISLGLASFVVTLGSESAKRLTANVEILIKKRADEQKSVELAEPRINVLVPAVQAYAYCYDTKELAEMFERLIAATLLKDMQNLVHPAYVEIVKQLSPLDATNFKNFYTHKNYPAVELSVTSVIGKPMPPINIFHPSAPSSTPLLDADSLDNLMRLGLVTVNYNAHVGGYDYSTFDNHREVVSTTKYYEEWPNEKICRKTGIISVSHFGYSFGKICID